jgi:hypothetical protein
MAGFVSKRKEVNTFMIIRNTFHTSEPEKRFEGSKTFIQFTRLEL